MANEYIPLNSILSKIQNSMYKINKNSSKGIIIKNIDLTLHCLLDIKHDTDDIMVNLLDFNQATNKDFKETTLSQMKFTLCDVLIEKKEKPSINNQQNINNTKEKEGNKKSLNTNKKDKLILIKYYKLPLDSDCKKRYNTIM